MLLQLDRPQEGKSEERNWSRNGLGSCQGVPGSPVAPRCSPAAAGVSTSPGGAPHGWLTISTGEDGAGLVTSFSSLTSWENTMRECVHVRGHRDREAPAPHSGGTGISPCPCTHWPVAAGSVKTSFQHRRGEVHVQRASKAASPQPQKPQGQGSRRVQGKG